MSELLDEGYFHLLSKAVETIKARIKREWNTNYFGDVGLKRGYWLNYKIEYDLNHARKFEFARLLKSELLRLGYSARLIESSDNFDVYVRVEEKKV